jgi:hypothetical protein
MQEMIRFLEVKLLDTERRTKKESAKEIKRLKRQIEKHREAAAPFTQREATVEDRPLMVNIGDRSERVHQSKLLEEEHNVDERLQKMNE